MQQQPVQEDPSLILGDSLLLDRPSLLFSNLLAGNLGGAGESLYAPSKLSPEERKSIATRFGLNGTPLESLVNVATNPLVLFGLVMTARWPRPGVMSLRAFDGTVRRLKSSWGLASFANSVMDNVRGTKLFPLLESISSRMNLFVRDYHSELIKLSKQIKTSTGRSTLSEIEAAQVGAILDGLTDINSPVMRKINERAARLGYDVINPLNFGKVSKGVEHAVEAHRTIYKQIYERLFSDSRNVKKLTTILGLDHDNIEELKNYLPHVLTKASKEEIEELLRIPGNTAIVERQIARAAPGRQSTSAVRLRKNAMMPDPVDLKLLGADNNFIDVVKKSISYTQGSLDGEGIGDALIYSLNANTAMERYLMKAARSYAYSIPPVYKEAGEETLSLGQRLLIEKERIRRESAYGAHIARVVEDTVVPQMLGMNAQRSAAATWWAAQKEKAFELINHTYFDKVPGVEGVRKSLLGWLADDKRSSFSGVGSSLSEYFHASTIGFPNITSPIQNLTQPIHAAGFIGFRGLQAGWAEATRRQIKLYEFALPKSMGGKGMAFNEAFERAYPEMVAAGLELDPQLKGELADTIASGIERLGQSAATMGLEKVRQAIMLPFGQSEIFNRATVFYGSRRQALKELKGQLHYFVDEDVVRRLNTKEDLGRAANDYGRQLTYRTMYGGGPLQKPMGTLGLWQPVSQLSTFPIRQLGLLGEVVQHPGILGRTALGSGLLYSTLKEVSGQDLSQVVFTGGLPFPTEREGVFGKVPLISPFVQTAGGAAYAALTGNVEPLQQSLPTLVPGGVGLSRILPNVPGVGEYAAGVLNKPYVDYERPTQDGRFPYMSRTGTLIGYLTPGQIAAKALGVSSATPQQESKLLEYLMAQKEVMAEMKREYIDARATNDTTRMMKISGQMERKFPGFGGMNITEAEASQLHMREDVSRIERFVAGLPAAIRPHYMSAVATSLGAGFEGFLGLQAGGWDAGTTPPAREAYRTGRTRAGAEAALGVSSGLPDSERIRQGAMQARPHATRGNTYRDNWYPSDLSGGVVRDGN